MTLNAGQFNKRITLKKQVDGTDDSGYPALEWVEIASLWSMVKTVSAREYVAAKATQSENIVRFVIRYRKGLDEDMVVAYNGKEYEIQSIINDDERNVTMTIIGKVVA